MERLESGHQIHDGVANEETERGRDAIPTMAALDAQIKLVALMVGESLWSSVSKNESEKDRLVMEWMAKYANDDFNGFQEYCDAHADDGAFIERAKNMKLEDSDFKAMQVFFEESPKGSVFITRH